MDSQKMPNIQFINITENNIPFLKKDIMKFGLPDESYALIKLNELTRENRIRLRKIYYDNPNNKLIVISSNPHIAIFAWRLHALTFLSFPLSNRQRETLREALIYHRQQVKVIMFKFPYLGGFDLISSNSVNFIKGEGQYIKVGSNSHNIQTYTKRMKEITTMIDGITSLLKVNRSIVVNLNNIVEIKANVIVFRNGQSIKAANQPLMAIKKALLWDF